MKYLPLLFILFSLFNSVHAQNLCEATCEFSVTFPEGGSFEAIDELTLTFGTSGELILGTGGTVNTAIQPSNLDYSSGGTLTLSAGESITFGPGGSLVLGTRGNMDAGSYSLETTGDISIGATGGNQSIQIAGDIDVSGTLSFTSPSLELYSTITAGSQVNLENSTTMLGSGTISVPESATISVGGVENIQPTSVTLNSTAVLLLTGTLNIQPLDSLDPLNGLELPTSDGSNCIVESPECISGDGTIYILNTEGSLVKKEAPSDTSTSGKSGSFSLPIPGFFMILLFLSRYRKRLSSGI